ncbi:hypothetical protein ABZ707_11755 [Streptomyces sp. NPDC006923]|uniref:hypothetical protein n=1 Tax=Streptomyces sp. NPDC006923 TaxID=3155355 RepID=UPI0033E128C1
MNLRVIGLVALVVTAALLPLAASAGPVGGPRSTPPAGGTAAPLVDATVGRVPVSAPERPAYTEDSAVRLVARCGPEVVSPDGLTAQTCVLTEGRDTWARTYYRNATGGEPRAVLSLMGPGGRTVQAHCAVAAGDEPGICETPREPSRGTAAHYTAMVEFAGPLNSPDGPDGQEIGPLLLRSGSNSAPSTAL